MRNNIIHLFLSLRLIFLGTFVVYNTSEVVQKRFTHEISRLLTKTSSTRSLLFTHSLDIIKKQPIIGYGAGSFTDIFRKINKKTENIVRHSHRTPHNNYLYVWIELGILGLIILISIFYFQIRELKKL